MADVFDKDAPAGERERLWRLIDKTPELDWLLLTKRVGNAKSMMLPYFEHWLPQNVWLGISVVNQEEADRDIPKLLELQARTRWLSIEPMLGPVNIKPWVSMDAASVYQRFENGLRYKTQRVDWIIVGGESGPRSRMMRLEWARSVREQCAAAGVPFFFKQGSNTPEWPKFKDFATYPPELQVREFPRVA
jgi:protein gp37